MKKLKKLITLVLSICLFAALPESGVKALSMHPVDEESPLFEEAPVYGDNDQLRAIVARFYRITLQREPDADGWNHWVEQLENQRSDGANLAHSFFHSPEFLDREISNEEYVTMLYTAFFDREPDEEGFAGWLDVLTRGGDRNDLLRGFVNSQEFSNLCDRFGILRGYMMAGAVPANPGIAQFVSRLYTVVLERNYESEGLNGWTQKIADGEVNPCHVAAVDFIGSPEFSQRVLSDGDYIRLLYNAFFGRPADDGGYAYWMGQIGYGALRNEIVYGFSCSAEFRDLVESYGLTYTEEGHYNPRNSNPYTRGIGIKGVQGDPDPYPQGFMNLYLDEFVWNEEFGVPYEFEGKTYYFTGDLDDPGGRLFSRIRELNEADRAVNAVFILRYTNYPFQQVLCDANAPAGAGYYLPASSGEGGDTMRALWTKLASRLQEYGLHIDNYIYGNEANSTYYCYESSFDVATKAAKYAEGFYAMYDIVTRYNPDTRCSIAIDHSWNLTFAPRQVLPAKAFLDNVAAGLAKKGNVNWFVSTHMYPAKVNFSNLWDGNPSVTQSPDSEMFDARNLKMVTDYIKNTYGAQHRVMLTENGFESNVSGETNQAAALAYSYYVAKYNDMVDCFILNANNELAAGGECDFSISGKLAGAVWNYLDDGDPAHKDWIDRTFLPVIGASSWKDIVPGYTD
ncbi:MAG: DUF4214 domain-containing protein [Lachnospiraceae bacterium]|nr:DUF4214 domain-containing protein [Lachnospiraceae bacterium]